MIFMFCTAAPDAPFPRLSNSAVTIVCSSWPQTMSSQAVAAGQRVGVDDRLSPPPDRRDGDELLTLRSALASVS